MDFEEGAMQHLPLTRGPTFLFRHLQCFRLPPQEETHQPEALPAAAAAVSWSTEQKITDIRSKYQFHKYHGHHAAAAVQDEASERPPTTGGQASE